MTDEMGPAPSDDEESAQELITVVGRRLYRASVVAFIVGALVTYSAVGFVLATLVGQSESNRLGLINGPIVALLAFAFLFIGPRVVGEPVLRPIGLWLSAGRPADRSVVEAALRLPSRLARRVALIWALATIGFVALNLALTSAGGALSIGVTMILGGLTTAALIYLLAERAARPLTIAVLATEPVVDPIIPGVRARLLSAWALGTGVPLVAVVAMGIVGVAKADVNPDLVGEAIVFLGAVAVGAGLLVLLFTAKSIAEPIAAVRRGLKGVQSGDYLTRVPVDDASEVGLLEAGFNRMAEGLHERERLRDLFGRHVGRDVAAAALGSGIKLGGEEREVAALFVDVTGSTALAARLPPSEVVSLLNRFFAIVVGVVEANGGLVNKFEGDAALCVFGAPVPRPNPATDALRAAPALARRLRSDVSELDFGIGISVGLAVAGNIGAEERFEYTVIGDPVNEAARLCDLAKLRPERVIAASQVLEAAGAGEASAWRLGEAVTLRGRDEETRLALPSAAVPISI
jgi:adenylate cyclase